jgi:hypothetical protein
VNKIDFKKAHPELYRPSAKCFTLIDVPVMQFAMIDGEGNPNTAAS